MTAPFSIFHFPFSIFHFPFSIPHSPFPILHSSSADRNIQDMGNGFWFTRRRGDAEGERRKPSVSVYLDARNVRPQSIKQRPSSALRPTSSGNCIFLRHVNVNSTGQ